jgi:pilus assembly protein CpaB
VLEPDTDCEKTMLQHADPEALPVKDEAQDSLRQEVEQIIAQRLERRNLMKPKPEPSSQDKPPAGEPTLRRTVTAAPADTADERPMPDFAAFEDDTAHDQTPGLATAFDPMDDPPEFDQPQRLMERREGDRRQGERRNMEFLRTELPWSSSPEPEEKRGLFGPGGFKRSRFLLLALAAVSAAVATALVLTNSPAPPPPLPALVEPVIEKSVEVPMTRILIATATIGAGQPLSADSLGWHDVPVSTLLPAYISADAEPEAIAAFDQSIARYPFLPGDPIRADKLLTSPRQSLAATLANGMRGVSVVVTADAAAGGFIKPDDHVDVILATKSQGQSITRTVLGDVRVIAINAQLGPSTTGEATEDPSDASTVFKGMALATLELDPDAAEVLVRAAANGSLTLTLRPPGKDASTGSALRSGANQAIRLTSAFWNENYSSGAE